MSITPQDFETAKSEYVTAMPDIDALKAQMRELNKEQKKRKDIIFQYMRENDLDGIEVGGISFERTQTTRLKLTEDLLEEIVTDAQQLEQIRADNSVSKETFKVKKRKLNNNT